MVKNKKYFYFDGTMLVSSRKIKQEDRIFNVLAFEQTNIKRNIGQEYKGIKIKPELYFVFSSKESIDSLIKSLEYLKHNFGIVKKYNNEESGLWHIPEGLKSEKESNRWNKLEME